MFSINDIIQIAVTIEKNGEDTYRDAARKVGDPDHASMLDWLADQEQEHGRWFLELGARAGTREPSPELAAKGRSMLRDVVGTSKFSLEDVDLTKSKNLAAVLDAAIELELDTVIFYQMLAAFVEGRENVDRLEEIIEEEKRHGRLLTERLEGL
jgi:rubrerythrin